MQVGTTDDSAALATALVDCALAHRWAQSASFPDCSRRWTWCRAEWPLALVEASDTQALANVFWPWIEGIERERYFERIDPLDFAHFAAGSLLHQLLLASPGPLSSSGRAGEVHASTRLALTFLAASRAALGAPALSVQLGASAQATWASFLENVHEDASLAVPFLDSFTGRVPVWHFPLTLSERPALQRAMHRARAGGASGPVPVDIDDTGLSRP